MSLPIIAPTPWDQIVRIGIPYHGYFDSDFNAWSRSGVSIDLSDKNYDVVYGPVRIFDFGMPAVSTTTEENSNGMYWANYAVFSGPNRIYNSIRSNGIGTQIKLDKKAWIYKCTDGQSYIITVWSGQLYAERLYHPRADLGNNSTGQAQLSVSSYGSVVKWVNASKTGKRAAIRFDNQSILEVIVSGGSKTEYPTIAVDRYRTWSSSLSTTTIVLPSPAGFEATGNDNWLWPNKSMFEPKQAFSMSGANGSFVSTYKQILSVDYDPVTESPMDIGIKNIIRGDYTCSSGVGYGDDPEKKWQTVEAVINYEDQIFCGSRVETYRALTDYYPAQTVSFMDNLTGSNPSGFDVIHTDNILISGNPYLIHGSIIVVSNIAPRYYTNAGVEYQYNDTVDIYGFACQFGSGFSVSKIAPAIPFLFFSINPFSGNYEPGKIGYF